MKRRLQPLWTFNEVLDVLGGPGAVGDICEGKSCACVCNWRSYNGKFPAKYYWDIKAALADTDPGYFAPISLFTFNNSEAHSKENNQAA
jgi:hypothetical protein